MSLNILTPVLIRLDSLRLAVGGKQRIVFLRGSLCIKLKSNKENTKDYLREL